MEENKTTNIQDIEEEKVTLDYENGESEEFYVIAELDYKGKWYAYLEPVVKPEGYMDGELLIYELTVDEATGDDVYTPVYDDNLLEALIDMLNDELEKSMEYDN